MMSCNIPEHPSQEVRIDHIHLKESGYIISVDNYSKIIVVRKVTHKFVAVFISIKFFFQNSQNKIFALKQWAALL